MTEVAILTNMDFLVKYEKYGTLSMRLLVTVFKTSRIGQGLKIGMSAHSQIIGRY